jgi:hypothetical protein
MWMATANLVLFKKYLTNSLGLLTPSRYISWEEDVRSRKFVGKRGQHRLHS